MLTLNRKKSLENRKIAILSTDGFDGAELFNSCHALLEAGAQVEIIAPTPGVIIAWKNDEWGRELVVDRTLSDAFGEYYDALFLPGGIISADKLRQEKEAIEFVESFLETGKPIATMGHGAWILIETGELKGKSITASPSLKTDLINAGANWVDEGVHVDHVMISSQSSKNVHLFNQEMIEAFYGYDYVDALPMLHVPKKEAVLYGHSTT